jgi:hypothetical protein
MKPLITACCLMIFLSACDLTGDMHTTNIKGYDFSLYEIQRYCSIERIGDTYLTTNCTLAKLKPVTRQCEGEIYGGLADVRFQCKKGLSVLTDFCTAKMYGIKEGGFKCRI